MRLLCACAYDFLTIQIFQFLFQDFVVFCSLWCLWQFSRFFGAAISHQAFLCYQQAPGFKSRLVPHQYSESGMAESSLSGSSLKSCNNACIFHFILSLPKDKHWVELFFFFSNHTKLCWLGGRGIVGDIQQLFLPISMWLFLALPFPGILSHLN